MARKRTSLVHLLILAPWWLSAALAPIAYFALLRIVPSYFAKLAPPHAIGPLASRIASYAFFVLLFLSFISALRRWGSSRQLEAQDSTASLVQLRWKEFENLMAEAFRRQGYQVTENLGGGADGGIDLDLHRNGQRTIVQCKRWKGRPVPVQVVRELYGVLTHEKAHAAKLVATTHFTKEAAAFAAGKPVELIDADALLQLIRGVQVSQKIKAPAAPPTAGSKNMPAQGKDDSATPSCPRCSSPMVLRRATRGPNEGQSFWGCPKYPACKGTRQS